MTYPYRRRAHRGIALSHGALYCDRAAQRINDAGEFNEHPIAGGFYDATRMLKRMVETLAELLFIGDQVVCLSHDQAVRSGPAPTRLSRQKRPLAIPAVPLPAATARAARAGATSAPAHSRRGPSRYSGNPSGTTHSSRLLV